MKLLITGLIDSIYTYGYIKSLKKARPEYEIDVLDMNASAYSLYEKNEYVDRYFSVEKSNSLIEKIPKIRGIQKLRNATKLVKSIPEYDVLHVHYADSSWAMKIRIFAGKYRKLLMSIWGSDFYRTNTIDRQLQQSLFSLADLISFGNPNTMEDYKKVFSRIASKKLRLAYFGSPNIYEVRRIEDLDRSLVCKKLGIPFDVVVVTIGYNNSPHQQHEKIIKSLELVKDRLPNNILLALPMTYGGNSVYRDNIVKLMNNSDFNHLVFPNFMQDEEVAMLRVASEIMIQVQTTDSLSSSMRESLYAGNVVITGDWLPYGILDEKGVFMLKVSSVEEVGEKLVYAVNNLDSLKEKCKKNPEIIWELSSWEKNIQSWIDIYEELLQKER